MKMTEREFQDLVIRLADTCGWLVYHTHDSRGSRPGFPDLTMVSKGKNRLIFAELKTEKGHLQIDQQYWKEHLEGVSHIEYYLWRPKDWNSGFINKILSRKDAIIKEKSGSAAEGYIRDFLLATLVYDEGTTDFKKPKRRWSHTWVEIEDMAKEEGITKSGLRRVRQQLVKEGLIRCYRIGGKNSTVLWSGVFPR